MQSKSTKKLKKLTDQELLQAVETHKKDLALLSNRINEYPQKISTLMTPLDKDKLKLSDNELKKLGLAYEKITGKEKFNLRDFRFETWVKFDRRASEFAILVGERDKNIQTFNNMEVNVSNKDKKKELVAALKQNIKTYNEQVKQLNKFEANFNNIDIPFSAMRRLDNDFQNIRALSQAVDSLLQKNPTAEDKQKLTSIKSVLGHLEGNVRDKYRSLLNIMNNRDYNLFTKGIVNANVQSAANECNQYHQVCIANMNKILTTLESVGNKATIDSVISKVKTDLNIATQQQPANSEKQKDGLVDQAKNVIKEGKEAIAQVVNSLVVNNEQQYHKVHQDAVNLKTALDNLLSTNRATLPTEVLNAATALTSELNTAVKKYESSIKTIKETKYSSAQEMTNACTVAKNTLKQECLTAINTHKPDINRAPGFFNQIKMLLNDFLKAVDSKYRFIIDKTEFTGKADIKARLFDLKTEASKTHDDIGPSNVQGPKIS